MNNNNKSSIYLADVSVVDHGYIDNNGKIKGGSFNPGFIITGEIDDVEQVVIDFSTVKKSVKHLIDQHMWDPINNGFDHKIWWIEGYSNGTLEFNEDLNQYIITTPALTANIPTDTLKIITKIKGLNPTYSIEYTGKAFEQYLNIELDKIYPNVNVSVQCFNNINVHVIDKNIPLEYFTYSHGLKDSTSYGCQNILHGHLSYIQHTDEELIQRIANDLDGAVFINKSNIVFEDDFELTIMYNTPQRGHFSATYKKDSNKIIILDTETTIEWIAFWLTNTYQINDFYVSEGLSKGTFV